MLLIFEKTISEPNFAPTYAKFCKVLFMEIKTESSKKEFGSSLIYRIQQEFETNVNDADAKRMKLQPLVDKMEASNDPKERLELQAEIEDQEYQFRRRAWGTVRFIGEMYKLQSLTSDRVLNCIESLLEHGSEEKLEYMCKLLTTVGHLLESLSPEQYNCKNRMDTIFRKIHDIVKQARSGKGITAQQHKISSRVRFMMQDVMDLRARFWDQPHPPQQQQHQAAAGGGAAGGGGRRGNAGSGQGAAGLSSKQQQQHHDDKQSSQSAAGSGTSSNSGAQLYDKGTRFPYGNQGRQGRQMTGHDGGNYFMQKPQKSQFMHQQQQQDQKSNIDLKKLNFSRCDEVTPSNTKLGNPSIYMWRTAGKPSSVTSNSSPSSSNNNSTSSLNASSQPIQILTGANNANLKRLNSAASQSSATHNPYLALDKPESPPECISEIMESSTETCSNASRRSTSPEEMPYSPKECQKILNDLVEEYLDNVNASNNTWHEELLNVWKSANNRQQVSLLYYLLIDYLHLDVVRKTQRQACCQLFTHLMRSPVSCYDSSIFCQAYAQFAEEFPEVLVDVPNGWAYVFEFLGPILHERLLNFPDIWQPQWAGNHLFTERFLKAFIQHFKNEFGANYVSELWHKRFRLDHGQIFKMDETRWRNFLSSNNFDFLHSKPNMLQKYHKINSNDTSSNAYTSRSIPDHMDRLRYLLQQTSTECDFAIDYIQTNVNVNDHFIKALTKFLCCDYAMMASNELSSAHAKNQLNTELFRHKCVPLLRLCIDAKEFLEIETLNAVIDAAKHYFADGDHQNEKASQAASSEFICNIFDILYDCELIAKESFEKWYRSRCSSDTNKENTEHLDAEVHAYMKRLL